MVRLTVIACLGVCLATGAQANLSVRFLEGAPKDKFVFENVGNCALTNAVITVDLQNSDGMLIFDVTGQGAGVSVFQPFEVVEGASFLRDLPTVLDGDTAVRLSVSALAPDDTIAFTIDVDDTVGQRATIVAGSEISGASAVVEMYDQRISGFFTENASALLALPPCPQS